MNIALEEKSNVNHTHSINDITNLKQCLQLNTDISVFFFEYR